jgi:hypothetical protein
VRRLDAAWEKAPAERTNKIRRDLERMVLELELTSNNRIKALHRTKEVQNREIRLVAEAEGPA